MKLYCECFANGEFCIDCNCQDCSNVIGNEQEIDEIFKTVKVKNPVALILNQEINNLSNASIGCNCTKSNCSKKYCECYKKNMQCTESCRCIDCSNASEEVKMKKKLNKNPVDPNIIKFSYDDFSFEKISVLIENSNIYIDKFEQNNLFVNAKKITTNNCAVIKNVNNSFYIEIKKSIIENEKVNFSSSFVKTQSLGRFLRTKRNISLYSLDSIESMESLDSTSKELKSSKKANLSAKTACETSKKTRPSYNDSSIKKKLDLNIF